jgi:DNA primase
VISDSVLEQLRGSADIVAIIGEYVPLKRAGNSFRGPCPFHNGKDANFSVQPGRGYNCFVCGEKGDAIAFIQKKLGLDFAGAVRLVAEKSGMQLPVDDYDRKKDPRLPFWELNAAAAEWFIRQFRGHTPTREYIQSRGFDLDQVAQFGIGYAPANVSVQSYLQSLGWDDGKQLAGGLLKAAEEKKPARALFRDRLMFPIGDAQGNAVGFSGRAMGDFQPKYLNSAESPRLLEGQAPLRLLSREECRQACRPDPGRRRMLRRHSSGDRWPRGDCGAPRYGDDG